MKLTKKNGNSSSPVLLIVDDNPDDRLFYKQVLAATAFSACKVFESETGQDGLEICKKENPDCIILDYILPDMDGLEFMSQYRDLSLSGSILMFTGQGDETVAVLAMKNGACDYIVKELLTPQVLSGAIAKTLRPPHPFKANGNAARDQINGLRKPHWRYLNQKNLIDEIKIIQDKLEISSGIDPETGLQSRKGMMEKIHYEILRFQRYKRPFTLIMADIEDYGNIAQEFSPEISQQVLLRIGKLFNDRTRGLDIICHWAEERFMILLPETDLEGGSLLAGKFCSMIEAENFVFNGKQIPLQMSFRVGVYNDENQDINECIQQADQCYS